MFFLKGLRLPFSWFSGVLLGLSLWSASATAKIQVVTTLPDIAEVAQAIGGVEVEVQSLLQGSEDPHYSEARPDYILKVSQADIVCSMGLELEVGWLPKVLDKSGNAKVQDGGAGVCTLGKSIKPLEVAVGVINRSLGHVHAEGNPHFNLSPLKLAEAGQSIVTALSKVAPEKAVYFQENYAAWSEKMKLLHKKIGQKTPEGPVMEYHKEFTYFFDAYGIKSAGSLEDKPGTPPSAARIAQVAKLAKEQKVQVLLASPSAPHKTLERFQELSGIPFKVVPSYLHAKGRGSKLPTNIEELQTHLMSALQ